MQRISRPARSVPSARPAGERTVINLFPFVLLAAFLATALAGCADTTPSATKGETTAPTASVPAPTVTGTNHGGSGANGGPYTTAPPTDTPTPGETTSTPAPTSTGDGGNNGFCGPPQCSPCPPQAYLSVAPATEDDAIGRARADWDTAAVDNKTAEVQALLDEGHAGYQSHAVSDENATRIMRDLYDIAAAQGGDPTPTDGQWNPIIVSDAYGLVEFSLGHVVC
jgi:hypothetical protein